MPEDYRSNNNERVPAAGKGDVEAALAAGTSMGVPMSPGDVLTYTVVPKGYDLKSLEDFLPHPSRIREEVALHDADSFIKYLNDFMSDGSRIFFDASQEQFHAVLDYHSNGEASWCSHHVLFTPRRSEEFKAWMASNRKQMSQVEFARFIEDNLPDVKEPNSAEFLQVALTFEAKKSVDFASGVRLANGQIQFQFDEVIRGTAQKGTMEVPEQFVLGIPIFMNGPAYRIPVRLRWRLDGSKLQFWFEIVRPHKFLEDAINEIIARVESEAGLTVLAGSRAK